MCSLEDLLYKWRSFDVNVCCGAFDFINHVKNTYYSVINHFGILKGEYSFGKRCAPICWIYFQLFLLGGF